jgi:hypothetical protein
MQNIDWTKYDTAKNFFGFLILELKECNLLGKTLKNFADTLLSIKKTLAEMEIQDMSQNNCASDAGGLLVSVLSKEDFYYFWNCFTEDMNYFTFYLSLKSFFEKEKGKIKVEQMENNNYYGVGFTSSYPYTTGLLY